MEKTFNILIVDDKKLDCEGICYLIKQNNLPLNTETASNGNEALSLLKEKRYDILLTDIRMPNMTGLELINKAKEFCNSTKFIVFSSYDDFEYAKTAINIGIEDYLLKPIKIDDFTSCFNKVIKKLTERSQQEISYKLYNLLFNCENNSESEPVETGYLFSIDFVKPYYNHKNSEHPLPESFIRIPLNEFQCLYIAPDYNSTSAFIKDFQASFSNSDNRYLITCGGTFNTIEEMRQIFDSIEGYSKTKFFLTGNETVNLEDLTAEAENISETFIFDSIKGIATYVKRNQFDDADNLLHEIFTKIQSNRNIPIVVIKSACFSLANELFLNRDANSEDFTAILNAIDKSSTFEGIINIVSDLIHCDRAETSNILTIQKAIDIIHEKYMEDLRLESISLQVFLSPCYFSTLFKNTTGTSFLKYLTMYRVEKSKDLLRSTNMRIGEICEKVGYTNRSYFCNIFRNYCGMTPNQYREQKND